MTTEARKVLRLVFGIALYAGVSLLAGCLRTHSMKSAGQYRLDSHSGIALLLPPDIKFTTGTTQITKLDLGDRPAGLSSSARLALCSVHGSFFALTPESVGKHWEFQAPNASGWNTSAVYGEASGEWGPFLRKVAKLASNGCFEKKMSVEVLRQRLIEAMPLPAGEVLQFYYSLGSFGPVDLYPGMQIRIEALGTVSHRQSSANSVLLSVRGRSPDGVKLVLASSQKHLRGGEKMIASEVLSKFADYPLLRLFLEQGTTSSEPARHSILSGAKTLDDLNQMTDCIFRKGERGCASTLPGDTRILVSDGVISLLSTVTINGHTALYAPGTTLSQIIDENWVHNRGEPLKTVTLQRRYGASYAPVLFQRNREMASKLILINGDRIEF